MGKVLKRKNTKKAKRQNFKCNECLDCPSRDKCTKGKNGRAITTSNYQEYYDKADKIFEEKIKFLNFYSM